MDNNLVMESLHEAYILFGALTKRLPARTFLYFLATVFKALELMLAEAKYPYIYTAFRRFRRQSFQSIRSTGQLAS